jgi:hypothetical protein
MFKGYTLPLTGLGERGRFKYDWYTDIAQTHPVKPSPDSTIDVYLRILLPLDFQAKSPSISGRAGGADARFVASAISRSGTSLFELTGANPWHVALAGFAPWVLQKQKAHGQQIADRGLVELVRHAVKNDGAGTTPERDAS